MHSQNNTNSDLVWARMKYCPFWPALVSIIYIILSGQKKLEHNIILGYSSSATNNWSHTGQ